MKRMMTERLESGPETGSRNTNGRRNSVKNAGLEVGTLKTGGLRANKRWVRRGANFRIGQLQPMMNRCNNWAKQDDRRRNITRRAKVTVNRLTGNFPKMVTRGALGSGSARRHVCDVV
jgi:hypothetical protein